MYELSNKFGVLVFKLTRRKKRLLAVIVDVLSIIISFLLAIFMRLEDVEFLYKIDTYIATIIAMAIALSVFAMRGLYNTFTRHISIEAANTIILGSIFSSGGVLVSTLLLELQMPRSVPFIYATILCVFATSIRFFVRALGQSIITKERENVAIYGAGAAGIQLMEALKRTPNYHVRLFIDDNPELDGGNLAGVPIRSPHKSEKKLQSFEIETILLAFQNATGKSLQNLFRLPSDRPLKVKTIPSVSSLISGKSQITELTDIKIEDLLERELVEHAPELMGKTITDKTVLVTGAGGSIGSELCRQIVQWKPKKLIMLDVSEFASYRLLEELQQHSIGKKLDLIPLIGSVQNSHFVKRVFDQFDIDTTYHAAAYKHVPLMELNVLQCIENNLFGTLNVVENAIASKVKNFILISTDKAVNPTNFMGASKRFAEIICQTLPQQKDNTCFSIVRFGNVLGSSGSVVPLFKKQIENGGPVTLTHPEITRYFMTTTEASQLVIQAGSISASGKVFILDMGQPIKILELAKKMITLSGRKPIMKDGLPPKNNEIPIEISGLRPGEKLYEELSYDANLVGTVHPRIMTTDEDLMPADELKKLLSRTRAAVRNNDHESLYQIVTSITSGVSDVARSSDVFINQEKLKMAKIIPMGNHTKK